MADAEEAPDNLLVENATAIATSEYFDELLDLLPRIIADKVKKGIDETRIRGGITQIKALMYTTRNLGVAARRGMETGQFNTRNQELIETILRQLIITVSSLVSVLRNMFNDIMHLPISSKAKKDKTRKLQDTAAWVEDTAKALYNLREDRQIQKHGLVLDPNIYYNMAERTYNAATDLLEQISNFTNEVDFEDDEDMDGRVFDAKGNMLDGEGLPDRGAEWHRGCNRFY
jgi:hypothetical protein